MAESAVLERMLTEADPARTPRDSKPDAAALMTRDRIIRKASGPRRRSPIAVRWATGLAGAAAAAALAVAVLVPHGGAVAGTPRPLDFADAGSVADILEAAHTDLSVAAGPAEPIRSVRSATWAFHFDGDTADSVVVPELTTVSWEPDLSGRLTIVAGEAYDPADAAANAGAEVTSTGVVTTDLLIKAGEFGTPVVDLPGDSRDEILAALTAFGLPEEPTAYDVVSSATAILEQWTLTNAQEQQLLAILSEAKGAQPLGAGTDRLGRAVSGLRVLSPDDAAADVLLISEDTGRIVGIERTSLVDEGVISAGSIISYRMWDVDEGLVE
ncbi:hypothetical protein [Microbacterium sp. SD291]|uniref:hypothetical protein n=1 Tax=Microbacterium sp. SD291 TaxID=2782007 RepID=UPI001A97294E|nr:hypothetical protein [Microbacterium sp. SD291]MBO0981127.1 hypothetical protein [Microbacterium sp. SD291]